MIMDYRGAPQYHGNQLLNAAIYNSATVPVVDGDLEAISSGLIYLSTAVAAGTKNSIQYFDSDIARRELVDLSLSQTLSNKIYADPVFNGAISGTGLVQSITASSTSTTIPSALAVWTLASGLFTRGMSYRQQVACMFNSGALPTTTTTPIDGVTVTDHMRVLVRATTTTGYAQTISVATVSGTAITWTVVQDGTGANVTDGDTVWVQGGTAGQDQYWTYNGTTFVQTGGGGAYAPVSHTLGYHSDVTITSIASGEILKWNGSSWVNNTLSEAGIQPAGSYEPAITASTAGKYWDGTKTFVTISTSNVTEGTNLYHTNARTIASTLTGYSATSGSITASDTILSAINKLGYDKHVAVTLGTANGLSLSGQAISLAVATSTVTGALSNTDWTTFNSKVSFPGFGTTHALAAYGDHTHTFASLTSTPSVVYTLSGDITGTATVALGSAVSITTTMATASATVLGGVKIGANVTITSGVISVAAPYSHPTGDGNLHVPATGTTHNGYVLTAGATAGSLSWVLPTTYSLPIATASVLGGVKIGSNINVDANGVISIATYDNYSSWALQCNGSAAKSVTTTGIVNFASGTGLSAAYSANAITYSLNLSALSTATLLSTDYLVTSANKRGLVSDIMSLSLSQNNNTRFYTCLITGTSGTIAVATHECGLYPIMFVRFKSGTTWKETACTYTVDVNGNISWASSNAFAETNCYAFIIGGNCTSLGLS